MLSSTISSLGFTGHEHLDEVGLIHMNGRIYDAKIARFVQADPIIQDPLRVQSLNRYSYVWNNPLNATDPSGFTTRSMTPSQLSGDPEELDETEIEETITYGYWTNFSDFYDFSDSVSDNSYSVEWSGDGYNHEPSSGSSGGLYGNGNAQKAHELAELFWPGYDFGTCISQGGCSAATWGVAIIGIIPSGKAVALGVKGVVKEATKVSIGVPARVQSRINVSNQGMRHTMNRHFDTARAGNKSQFTLSESELRTLLSDKNFVQIQAKALETGNFSRTVTIDKTVGNLSEKLGGGSTNTFTVITDKFGNLQTAFPGGL